MGGDLAFDILQTDLEEADAQFDCAVSGTSEDQVTQLSA